MTEFYTAGSTDKTPETHRDAMELRIPRPTVSTHSFRLVCDLEPVRALGQGLHADGGHWITFTGGHFEASWGIGVVMPGGQDSQHVLSLDHPSAPYSAQLSTRYLLQTTSDEDGPHYIQVQTRGWRTGPPEVMERLAASAREGFTGVAPTVDEYKFSMDGSTPPCGWAAASGSEDKVVIYDAYLVE
ncbi:BZ3500_MvSof-1268-A1-R1_Chr3-1g05844 [Microbotryum saponariae]|uniref:BZ3500_MvSof-1268-A1-R1_Chr3-1g05844 protein n=1 Tax=Microbotryum saponariae TaxID=289078 RepID=A0A2X0L3Z1_9BASI|nr:BZ3500_MvSof-1268-A1-R1_Chr3-1g05844 [Microbotryum saponariae]SDA05034.1 BZ3501_MvSof-1269-A2-R1_Chr3-1g05514 [Microbotryum saponariae]